VQVITPSMSYAIRRPVIIGASCMLGGGSDGRNLGEHFAPSCQPTCVSARVALGCRGWGVGGIVGRPKSGRVNRDNPTFAEQCE
jgi:hypothetical protein